MLKRQLGVGCALVVSLTGCPKTKTSVQASDAGGGADGQAHTSAGAAPEAGGAATELVDAGSAEATSLDGGSTEGGTLRMFEGEMDVRIDDARRGSTEELALKVRGAKVRFATANQVRGAAAVGIYDSAHQRTTVVIEAQHAFMSLDAGAPEPTEPKWSVSKTGNHETVAGSVCDVWQMKSGPRKATACVAKGFPYFDVRQIAGTGRTGSWVHDLQGTEALPLRYAEYDARGQLLIQVETTRIARQTLPESQFAVPAGYAEVPRTPGGSSGLPR